jgi:hypothetical protein
MVYFVTENWMKTNGMITDNVDVTDFSPLIQNAAKAFLRKQIGTYFFNDLFEKYNAQTLSTDEEEVVAIMKYIIGWRATAEACVSLSYQLKNKGLQTQSGDNSEAVEDKVVWKMYDHYIQKCYVFEKDLYDYLIDNKDLFPNFTSTLNKDSSIKTKCNCFGGSNDTGFIESVGIMII